MRYKKRYVPTGEAYLHELTDEQLQADLLTYAVKDKYELLCRWSSMSPDLWQFWEVS